LKVILYFFARPRSFLSLSSAILRQWKKCQYVGKRRVEIYFLTADRDRYRRRMLRNKERVSEGSITVGNRLTSPGSLQCGVRYLFGQGSRLPQFLRFIKMQVLSSMVLSLSLEFLLLHMTRAMESETTASFVATISQRNRKWDRTAVELFHAVRLMGRVSQSNISGWRHLEKFAV
jgi:hypothetical protein